MLLHLKWYLWTCSDTSELAVILLNFQLYFCTCSDTSALAVIHTSMLAVILLYLQWYFSTHSYTSSLAGIIFSNWWNPQVKGTVSRDGKVYKSGINRKVSLSPGASEAKKSYIVKGHVTQLHLKVWALYQNITFETTWIITNCGVLFSQRN